MFLFKQYNNRIFKLDFKILIALIFWSYSRYRLTRIVGYQVSYFISCIKLLVLLLIISLLYYCVYYFYYYNY